MTMDRADGAKTYFWTILPLYAEELALKLRKGADALLEQLERLEIDDVVRQTRPNAAVRKRRFGLF